MVSPGAMIAHRTPPQYRTVMVPQTVMVAPPGVAYEQVPPQYATSERVEMVSPGYSYYAPVALRCPKDTLCSRLLDVIGGPVVSSSANLSGQPPAETAEDVLRIFGNQLDLVIDGGPRRGGMPSTLVDVSGPVPRLLRRGALDVTSVLGTFEDDSASGSFFCFEFLYYNAIGQWFQLKLSSGCSSQWSILLSKRRKTHVRMTLTLGSSD